MQRAVLIYLCALHTLVGALGGIVLSDYVLSAYRQDVRILEEELK